MLLLLLCVDNAPMPPAYIFWYHNSRMVNYDSGRGVRVQTRGEGDGARDQLDILYLQSLKYNLPVLRIRILSDPNLFGQIRIRSNRPERRKNVFFNNWIFLFMIRIRIHSSKSDPDPDKSRPDPQH